MVKALWIIVKWRFEWKGPREEFVKKPGSQTYWDGESFVHWRGAAKPFKWPKIAHLVARTMRAEVERQ